MNILLFILTHLVPFMRKDVTVAIQKTTEKILRIWTISLRQVIFSSLNTFK